MKVNYADSNTYMNINQGEFAAWIGNSESRRERISAAPATGLAAVLNREKLAFEEGDLLPPGWQWLYFLPRVRQDELGVDGHPNLGGFLPPVPLPRRMWAAGKMTIHRELRIGDEVERISQVTDISVKEGRSGPLVFVTVAHEFITAGVTTISEEQNLVYRDHAIPGQEQPSGKQADTDESWRLDITPDPTLLFRYSALTFNAHRIHYDRDYAVDQEHYPGLVVQGPLIATLLLELLALNLSEDVRVKDFSFRAIHPTFVNQSFSVCAKEGTTPGSYALWSRNHEGILAMEATASTRSR